jgi:serine/threonine protein kinase
LPIPVVKEIARQLLTAMATLHDDLKIIHTDVKPQNILFRGTMAYHLKIIDCFTKSEFDAKYQHLCARYGQNSGKFNEELEILAFESVREIYYLETEFVGNEEFIPDDKSEEPNSEIIEGEEDGSRSDSASDSASGDEVDDEVEDELEKFNEREQSVDDIVEHLDYREIHDLDDFYNLTKVLNNSPNTTDHRVVVDDKYVTNCETALTDFGNSYFYRKRTRNEIQDRLYRAPEIILDLNYGYMCDIWSVCCVIFELLTGFVPFDPDNALLNRDLHHLFLMEKSLGPMPLDMKKASKRVKFLFDRSRKYHIKNVAPIKHQSIKDRLMVQFSHNEVDATAVQEFLMCGLQYYPHARSSAKELLNHPWLKN